MQKLDNQKALAAEAGGQAQPGTVVRLVTE